MDESIKKELEKPLNSKHVSQRKQSGFSLSYIEGHHAIREANRIFGFDGWSMSVDKLETTDCGINTNENIIIHCLAVVTVEAIGVKRQDTGSGSGIAKTMADAIESATKEAVTDAMKRALRTFGDQFGNALYDKEQKHVVSDPVDLSDDVLLSIRDAQSVDELRLVWTDICKSDSKYADAVSERRKELESRNG